MVLKDITEDGLFDILNRELSASHPITSPEYLFGREKELERIHGALAMRGRQVFIFGDRGVGKTSLAQTAAYRYQSSEAQPIVTSCHEQSTFESVIQDILLKLRCGTPYEKKRIKAKKETVGRAIAQGPLSWRRAREQGVQIEEGLSPLIQDANMAALLLKHEAPSHSLKPIAVIDEFDLMGSTRERGKFADFLKQLGDQEVPVKFIFCGIADSLEDLLDAHPSAYRYLEGSKIERLNVSSRWDIIDKSADALGLTIDDNVRHRIAAISDGFPYYVHLICEKLYTSIFYEDEIVDTATLEHLHHAVNDTVSSIEHSIRRPYERVLQRTDGEVLERVLWALADHSDLIRQQRSIYESHQAILSSLSLSSISEREFTKLLAKLREKSCDVIRLHKGRRGLNEFKENIFRGYVRLRAEAKGLQLALDYAPARNPQRMHYSKVPVNVSPCYELPTYGRLRPFSR